MANLDVSKFFPDQRVDGDFTECCGLTIADIMGNKDGVLYDPDFAYSMGLYIRGQQPSTAGEDPYWTMAGAVSYGALSVSLETFTAKTMGELYASNYNNYTALQKSSALSHVENGFKALYTIDDIKTYMLQYRMGASLAMHWYQSFMTPNPDGSLPQPSGQFSYHNVAVYDAGDKGLMIKPWLGANFGDGGYVYLSPALFDQVFVEAYGFTLDSNRFFSQLKIMVLQLQYGLSLLKR